MLARSLPVRADHAGKAVCAARIASCACEISRLAISAIKAPVAGLWTVNFAGVSIQLFWMKASSWISALSLSWGRV